MITYVLQLTSQEKPFLIAELSTALPTLDDASKTMISGLLSQLEKKTLKLRISEESLAVVTECLQSARRQAWYKLSGTNGDTKVSTKLYDSILTKMLSIDPDSESLPLRPE
jgi:hypothetical protein